MVRNSLLAVLLSTSILFNCKSSKTNQTIGNEDEIVAIGTIYFEPNSSEITSNSITRLDSVGNFLSAHKNIDFEGIGSAHPSEIGYKNDKLALDRVSSVYNYLFHNFNIETPKSLSTYHPGPALGQDSAEFIAPALSEYRSVQIKFL